MESDQSSCYNIVKSGFGEVMILNFDPTILELDMNYVLLDHEIMLCVIVILLSLFMMLLKIIMREGNMVILIFMLLRHLSFC